MMGLMENCSRQGFLGNLNAEDDIDGQSMSLIQWYRSSEIALIWRLKRPAIAGGNVVFWLSLGLRKIRWPQISPSVLIFWRRDAVCRIHWRLSTLEDDT